MSKGDMVCITGPETLQSPNNIKVAATFLNRKESWSAGHFKKNVCETKIKIFTLDSLLEKHNFKSLDVLVVDTEGTELDVLAGFSINKYKPTIAVIECNQGHKLLGEKSKEINDLMKANNYEIIHFDAINTVFYRNI